MALLTHPHHTLHVAYHNGLGWDAATIVALNDSRVAQGIERAHAEAEVRAQRQSVIIPRV
jgi:hypothetical protein